MRFKLSSVAVGTRDLPGVYEDVLLELGEYIETAIEYNNDFILSGRIPKTSKIITRIHDITSDFLIANHLKYLKRNKVDILLIDKAAIESKEDLERISQFTESLGIYGSGLSAEDIDKFKEIYGSFPEYISMPINPYNFKKSLYDKAKKEEIKVIGYEILGGPLQYSTLLGVFGLQFLTRFAAYHCDIACISTAANLTNEVILSKTLNELCKDIEFMDNSVYELKKDSFKPAPGVTRLLHTYSEVSISGKNHIFKNDYNGFISDEELIVSSKENLELIPGIDLENLKPEDNINMATVTMMSEILNIKCTTWKEEVSAFYRYLVIGSLKSLYSTWRYKILVSKTGNVIRITVTDRLKFWAKSFEYILYISERIDGGYNVFFRNL